MLNLASTPPIVSPLQKLQKLFGTVAGLKQFALSEAPELKDGTDRLEAKSIELKANLDAAEAAVVSCQSELEAMRAKQNAEKASMRTSHAAELKAKQAEYEQAREALSETNRVTEAFVDDMYRKFAAPDRGE